MMLALLLEAALRSLALGGVVWLGLKLLRVRDPRAHMTSWTVVLAASLAMPLIMHWGTLTLPYSAPSSPLSKIVWATAPSPLEAMPAMQGSSQSPGRPAVGQAALSDRDAMAATPAQRVDDRGDGLSLTWLQMNWLVLNWVVLATGIYATVAGVLLLRLLIGITLTWRLVRVSRPIADTQGSGPGSNVRVCDVVGVPVTFASTILLPPECIEWSPVKRQAVLLHERSHVAHGDCYVLLLAALNRAVFWFSPFAWWQLARLAELAEMISDDAAIEELADRQSYAHILLDLAGQVRGAPAGLAMARACTVRQRVERILAATAAPRPTGWRTQIMIATTLTPVVAVCAGSIARSAPPQVVAALPPPAELGRLPPDEALPESGPVARDPRIRDSYVGYYRLDARSVIAITRDGDRLLAQPTGEHKLTIVPAGEREFVYKATSRISFVADGDKPATELILQRGGNELHAARIADVPRKDGPRIAVAADALDARVGWYELNPSSAVAVTRDGERLFLQFTGRPKFQVLALSEKDFVTEDGKALVIFMAGSQGGADQLLLHQPGPGVRSLRRIDAARAATIEDNFARWVAAAPDRFKNQEPAQGSRDGLLQAIADLRRDAPSYARMSPQLTDSAQRKASELHAMLTALGTLQSVYFRGVGPGGYDIYGAKFANGFAEVRLLMGADGTIENMLFRPDGDDKPGGFAACTEEPTLKPASGTAPIKLLIYNAHGTAIRLYELDAEGRRIPFGTVGDERTAGVQTYVGRPWVVTDTAGRCLEVILPGQRTRFVTVQPAGEAHPEPRRATPTPGSEETLRRYIDAVGRGEPNYDQMTMQTRQQLPLSQAILAKLGPLRAMSFRGVTPLGNDHYIVHFANGSAEWRIGLVKEGRIGRMALGPQF
jgi:bla regulator protein blaR1